MHRAALAWAAINVSNSPNGVPRAARLLAILPNSAAAAASKGKTSIEARALERASSEVGAEPSRASPHGKHSNVILLLTIVQVIMRGLEHVSPNSWLGGVGPKPSGLRSDRKQFESCFELIGKQKRGLVAIPHPPNFDVERL